VIRDSVGKWVSGIAGISGLEQLRSRFKRGFHGKYHTSWARNIRTLYAGENRQESGPLGREGKVAAKATLSASENLYVISTCIAKGGGNSESGGTYIVAYGIDKWVVGWPELLWILRGQNDPSRRPLGLFSVSA